MALIHEFFLIPQTTDVRSLVWGNEDVNHYAAAKAEIEDDLTLYIMDTLKWVPSKNPGRRGLPAGMGLNYHGVTLFEKESSHLLKQIFSSWRDLFRNAPDSLELTGLFIEGTDEKEGHYEMVIFSRDEIIRQLDQMVALAEKMGERDYCLYHWGI